MRYLIASFAALMIAGVYVAYECYVVPLTAIVVEAKPPPMSKDIEFQPPIFSEVADKHFADAAWTKTAQMKWQRSEQAFLYAEHVERIDDTGNVVEMSPLAIMWTDPRRPNGKPYRLIAEKARLQFEHEFFDSAIDLTDAEPGRIVWSSLEGAVHIDGPDGLVIDGQHFIFSEQSNQLYSDYPVSFGYGPTPQEEMQVVGTATSVSVNLIPATAPVLGKDMPRVSGVASLMLRSNVDLQAKFKSDGKPNRAHITSSGPFEFDVVNQTASFESDVRVEKLESNGKAVLKDELICEWLGLEFQKDPTKPVPAQSEHGFDSGMFDNMVFKRLRAVGTPRRYGATGKKVVLKSQEHGMVATMQDLAYDAGKKLAIMLDDSNVNVERGESKFVCPKVLISHTADNELNSMEGRGPGRFEHRSAELGPDPLEALWANSMKIAPTADGKLHTITLLDDAQLIVPDKMGIGANRIQLWFDMSLAEELQDIEDPLRQQLPLKRAKAEGDVRMVSQQVIVQRSQSVDTVIVSGQLPVTGNNSILQTSGTRSTQSSEPKDPWTVESDEIQVTLLHDVAQGAIDVDKVVGIGHVKIVNDSQALRGSEQLKIEGPLELTGVKLIAETNGGRQETVTLLGEIEPSGDVTTPAMFSMGPTKIGGANIVVERDRNLVTINGAGAFRVPVPEDLSGQPLTEPAILEVVWRERMVFDGLTANFFGNVRCSLLDQRENISRLKCEELRVALNKRISFEDQDQRSEDLEVETITAAHKVELEAYEYDGTRLINVREAKLARFKVNQNTGEITGQGPGSIDVWSFGDTVRFSPTGAAQANQPARASSPKWRYTHVAFRGELVGNVHGNFVELRERVKVVSAPVPQARVTFDPVHLSDQTDQAGNAVLLSSDRLRATQKAASDSDRKFSELFAYGNTELEGQTFRAVADELSFDEQLGRFVIRGLGREATLYFQKSPGDPVKPSAHRLIEFIPSKPSISVDGSRGFAQ